MLNVLDINIPNPPAFYDKNLVEASSVSCPNPDVFTRMDQRLQASKMPEILLEVQS